MEVDMKKLALILSLLSTPAMAQSLPGGWFVIAGSYPYRAPEGAALNSARVRSEAARCGFAVRNMNSDVLLGTRPGMIVQAIGGYAHRADAERALIVMRKCVPDAYVKRTVNYDEVDELD
jgi:hypothetical protein